MSYEERASQLQGWLREFRVWGEEGERFRFSFEGEGGGGPAVFRGSVIFCTAAHTYHLSFTDTYLGCVATSRIVRPGEDWTRGNDMPDGEFSRETFDRIIQGIVGYELVVLDPKVEPVAVAVEKV